MLAEVNKPNLLLQEQPLRAFSGWLEETTLADLVQLACLEGGKRSLLVQHQGSEGHIFFVGGEVVHATTAGSTGQEAFFEILSWQMGFFRLSRETTQERSIQAPWNFLVIEALRQTDERHKTSAQGRDRIVRVLIVEDSPVVCRVMRQILDEDADLEVIAEACNGRQALEMIEVHNPDILTLDVNMPVMGGDVALMHIMIRSPAPVVLVSSLAAESAVRVMEFLRLGAVDFVPKPLRAEDWPKAARRLRRSLRMAPGFQVQRVRRARIPKPVRSKARPGLPATRLFLVVGGVGGLLEIQKILPGLPLMQSTAVLVLQDMVRDLVKPLAQHLDQYSQLTLSVLEAGGPLLSGQCWVTNWQGGWEVVADDNGAAMRHVVAGGVLDITHLLASASAAFGIRLCVLVLSGADLDIAEGLRSVFDHGGRVLLQDPASCMAPALVKFVKTLGLNGDVVEVEGIAKVLTEWAREA